MIKARKFNMMDAGAIDRIYRKDPNFGIPSLDKMIINTTLVDENNIVVGYGVVKNFPEAVLRLDPDLRIRDKVAALRASMEVAIKGSKMAGEEHLYVVSTNDEFSRVLKNHFKFRDYPGQILVFDLEE